ncbi:cytochrome (ubi)quinol oxidase subunit III [Thermoactinomyces vulgaris]|uniref:cytochrome (ubi)quinol oxidase subunit III n=1 Tax=Thermoactinomyces vulgaris TaxID=2026 RepID=UPI001F361A39|nr:cytochrome (ubi)quinol oxidase subunit III [Thermoactinomyces vulgaris]MCF6134570.1 cytochrome (ubi)quinol oxidase subunit III [Thermoactinomyces vulgaris]
MGATEQQAVLDHQAHDHEHHEDQDRYVLGFWVFLASDLVLFASIISTYFVLRTHTDGGPSAAELFEIPLFTLETILLLTSSFTCGLAMHAMKNHRLNAMIGWIAATIALGLAFVGIEASEFVKYAAEGATMQRSAFLSGFYTLLGTHGLHVCLGMGWLASVMVQLKRQSINPATARKFTNAGLYWHFLDVVWILIFTLVYLVGVIE